MIMHFLSRSLVSLVLCLALTAHAEPPPSAPDEIGEAQQAYDEAVRLRKEGQTAAARVPAERALTLREKALGPRHLEVARCLDLLGDLASEAGEYAHAASLLQEGLEIREAALGPNHPDVASSLYSLARVYREQGAYERVEPLLQRSLRIREAALGPNHPDVAASLHGLAVVYQDLGAYGRAEPLLQRALQVREAALGRNHPDIANSLNSLAALHMQRGAYDRAEPLLQRALQILEADPGASHLYIATSLNLLATIYMAQGAYERAEPLYQRVLHIGEERLGLNHPEIAWRLNNLARLYADQGDYERAEPLYRRALEIRETARGQGHPDVAQSLDNLAEIYFAQGSYERVEPLLLRALEIRQAALGPSHPHVAASLSNLAVLYFRLGMYAQAEPLLQRALRICEAALGASHPDVASLLTFLARLHLAEQRLGEAVTLLSRALALSEGRLHKEALTFSESRLGSFLDLLRQDEERLYALLRAHADVPEVRRLALTAALLRKGRSAEELAYLSRTAARSLDARGRESFEHLRVLRTQRAQLSLQGPGRLPPADDQARLQALESQGDKIEAELALRSASLRDLKGQPGPKDIVPQVTRALPRDAALVELVAYEDEPLVPPPGTPESQLPHEPRYLALVLLPTGEIRTADLGPAAPIDQAVTRLREALSSRDARYLASAQELYRLAFAPLIPLLGPRRRVFISPEGQLGLVPLGTLHDGERFVADAYHLSYLTSGKDLLRRPDPTPASGAVAVFADPDFFSPSPSPTPKTPPNGARGAEHSHAREPSFSGPRAGFADRGWIPLPGTRKEAEAIKELLPRAQLFMGPAATKGALLGLPTPDILHVATHGFFLEDPQQPSGRSGTTGMAGTRALSGVGEIAAPASQQVPHDPLLRSGLVLAGAAGTAVPRARRQDALVTALEMSGMNLWGTELVVLSACETGRGEVKVGQGVYGLRRALVVAGAETVVTSLWRVDDETTRALMEAYYRNLLSGLGRSQALDRAMKDMRAQHPHPYYWAPFIVVGRDAPLRGLKPRHRHAASAGSPRRTSASSRPRPSSARTTRRAPSTSSGRVP
ncbi:MAG TPA: CHAT domain-containing tetratricopeptide repeat protein [Polyangia bacterium]|nr:CHAT domain-containing tetratricopeptide repeat protein [Polyangia bacterium]